MKNEEAAIMIVDIGKGPDPQLVVGEPAMSGKGGKMELFFGELSKHLGLDQGMRIPLAPQQPFSGPNGMICRIETQHEGTQLVARPQLVLPLDNEEIGRLTVPRVLSLQRALLSQLGWLLGESAEGLLQLSPLRWTREAEEVALELDLGSAVGRIVLTMLANNDMPEDRPAFPAPPH